MDASREYRQADAGTGSPLRVVVLLYEQLIKDLRGALSALARGDIEVRTKEIDHALLVAGQLQVRLDMKSGGGGRQQPAALLRPVSRGTVAGPVPLVPGTFAKIAEHGVGVARCLERRPATH